MTSVYSPEYLNYVYCPRHKAWWIVKKKAAVRYMKEFGN